MPTVAELEQRLLALKQELAAARRAAPPVSVKDYTLRTPEGAPVTLRQLFGAKRDLILIHNMGKRCVYCTMWADGFAGLTPHLNDRAAFVLASPDEPEVLKAFAASRGWPYRCVSIAGTSLAADLGYEPAPGDHHPGVSGLRLLDNGSIVRVATAPFGPGDDFCALWPMLDLLQDGIGGWTPKYDYRPAAPIQIGRS